MRDLIRRDYSVFSGKMLERYFHAKAAESHKFTIIDRWWDRKGENEIDMIAANEIENKAEICEIKRLHKKISLASLKDKADIMLAHVHQLKGFSIELKGLDLEDM